MIETDILIIGGGSGGFGAAIRAARADPKARILLLDSMAQLGGTSTVGGVNVWQAGISGPGVHYELYARLAPDAIGVGKIVHLSSKEEPYGFSRIDPHSSYESSLRTAGLTKPETRRVHFEPDVLAEAMDAMLREAGVEIRYRTRFADVSVQGRRIVSITAQPLDGGILPIRFAASSSSTAPAAATWRGKPSAAWPLAKNRSMIATRSHLPPDSASPIVNGISQVFRVTPAAEAGVDELPAAARAPAIQDWLATHRPAAHVVEYPNGDLCVNVLPTMEGAEFHSMPYPQAQAIGQARMHAHWRRMQTEYGFDRYRFKSMFPLVGIRESHRLVGRYVLREQDVRAGLLRQPRREEIIALADHPLDTHGARNVRGSNLKHLEQPYGIPYACLLPNEYDNLIAASRGASFSHIAASSCRLSRTMMALGEAAGVASALALRDGAAYAEVDVDDIREQIGIPAFVEKALSVWGMRS